MKFLKSQKVLLKIAVEIIPNMITVYFLNLQNYFYYSYKKKTNKTGKKQLIYKYFINNIGEALSNVTIFFLPILLEFTFVTMFFKNSEMNFDIEYLKSLQILFFISNSHEKSVPLLQDYDIEIDSILMFPYQTWMNH